MPHSLTRLQCASQLPRHQHQLPPSSRRRVLLNSSPPPQSSSSQPQRSSRPSGPQQQPSTRCDARSCDAALTTSQCVASARARLAARHQRQVVPTRTSEWWRVCVGVCGGPVLWLTCPQFGAQVHGTVFLWHQERLQGAVPGRREPVHRGGGADGGQQGQLQLQPQDRARVCQDGRVPSARCVGWLMC